MKKNDLFLIFLFCAIPLFGNSSALKYDDLIVCASKLPDKSCLIKLLKKNDIKRDIKDPKWSDGIWFTGKITDPLTDKDIYLASTSSPGSDAHAESVMLAVICKDDGLTLSIDWREVVSRSKTQKITYRANEKDFVSEEWRVIEDTTTTTSLAPSSFLNKLINSSSFVVQTTPVSGIPVTVLFDTVDAPVALADIRKACHW